MDPVYDFHDIKILLTFAMARIVVCLVLLTIDAATADINQFALPHDWNLLLIFGNECDALRWVQRFLQIFFEPVALDRELTNFLLQDRDFLLFPLTSFSGQRGFFARYRPLLKWLCQLLNVTGAI